MQTCIHTHMHTYIYTYLNINKSTWDECLVVIFPFDRWLNYAEEVSSTSSWCLKWVETCQLYTYTYVQHTCKQKNMNIFADFGNNCIKLTAPSLQWESRKNCQGLVPFALLYSLYRLHHDEDDEAALKLEINDILHFLKSRLYFKKSSTVTHK
jgi:hypothetical protein